VLVLEDNPVDVFVIKEVLESCRLDLQLRIFSNGQDALRYLEDLDRDHSAPCPALVLLDLNVPKVDGIAVLERLRRTSRCSRTPVVVVTSSNAETDRAAALRFGVEAYFQKPKDLTAYMELAQVIKSVLNVIEDGSGH
jgi:CheY-like chemotaxis protein